MALYRSARIGKGGKPFTLYKIKTLRDGADSRLFADGGEYTTFGHFLRRTKLDELPQLWNVLKGDMAFVGPRPEEQRTIDVLQKETRATLLSVKPGLTSLASVHFFDEERLLQETTNPQSLYWKGIKPLKILLDVFYIQNKCFLLDVAVVYMTLKKVLLSPFTHD